MQYNLAPYPSFENEAIFNANIDVNSNSEVVTWANDQSYVGSRSMKVECPSVDDFEGAWMGAQETAAVLQSPGQQVKVTYYNRVSVQGESVTFQAFSLNSGGNWMQNHGMGNGPIPTANTWTKRTVTVTPNVGAYYLGFQWYSTRGDSAPPFTFWLDAIRVFPATDTDEEYYDGDSPGWSWDGTSGYSTSQGEPPSAGTTIKHKASGTFADRELLVKSGGIWTPASDLTAAGGGGGPS